MPGGTTTLIATFNGLHGARPAIAFGGVLPEQKVIIAQVLLNAATGNINWPKEEDRWTAMVGAPPDNDPGALRPAVGAEQPWVLVAFPHRHSAIPCIRTSGDMLPQQFLILARRLEVEYEVDVREQITVERQKHILVPGR